MTKAELDTISDAGIIESIRRALADDKDHTESTRTVPRGDLQDELDRAVAAVLAEEDE